MKKAVDILNNKFQGAKKLVKTNPKYIISLFIVLVGILSLLGGTSYAILRGTITSDEEQLIKAGSIKLLLTEKFENIDKNITIKEDSDGLLSEDIYEFNIKNIGDAPAKFDLKLINEVSNSYTGDVLGLEYIKVGLEVNGEEHGPMSISEANNIIDSDILYEKEVINYTLRIWLDKAKEEELQTKEDYKAFLKLKVEAEQRPEEMEPKSLKISKTFSYTGDMQVYTIPVDGEYKLEVWGAQGGEANYNNTARTGGYGGYSTGTVRLTGGEKLYIYVGGMGQSNCMTTNRTCVGGYNGGGSGYYAGSDTANRKSSGGGATHIATTTGLLSTLENKQDKLLIVAGGGGGGSNYNNTQYGNGGHAGGYIANNGDLTHPTPTTSHGYGTGGNQTSGGTGTVNGTLGLAGGSTTTSISGGGGGYYGGGSGIGNGGAGGGSGYIGNSLLKDKTMYCYNCTTSNNASTKTISTTSVSENAVSKYAKKNNGAAKLTLINNTDREFSYTGSVQEYIAPRDGEYKLEVWGAQGGGYGANDGSYRGGYGGYSTGTVRLTGGEKLYIYVGGAGLTSTSQTANLMAGGYNGGGNSYGTTSKYVGSGGGATHIATTSGLLSTLENKQDKLLIVAGGGGGAGYESSWSSTGGNGGGIEGTNGTKTSSESFLPGSGGTQNSGGTTYQGTATFGQGANATADSIGGGGGYYGGGSGQYTSGGGGGSGYIGNSLLKDKSMYCYNCTTSSNTSTKTFSTTSVSDNAVSMYAKKDNGYAKISFVNRDEKEFHYTGTSQEYTVPRDGYYYIETAGAQGGSYNTTYLGGKGAKISGYVYLQANETIYFQVGSAGKVGTSDGGYNGGGRSINNNSSYTGHGGGGATDIRCFVDSNGKCSKNTNNQNWNDTLGLNSRIMVAAGGGGMGIYSGGTYYQYGGDGGTLNGIPKSSNHTGTDNIKNYQYGTQISAGYCPYSNSTGTGTEGGFGYGGANASTTAGTSGGGSGYYGGSGGPEGLQGGGGGSSFISGYAGCNSITSSTSRTHTNQTKHYSDKYFLDGKMTEGKNGGNGYAKIKYIGKELKKKNTKLNNVRYIKNCINYNTVNNQNHWVELQAIKDGINVAKSKTVTGSVPQSASYPYSRITDGDVTYSNLSVGSPHTANQCITVDLGNVYNLDEIAVWNYFGTERTYHNNITSVSSDNTSWIPVITEIIPESSNGHRFSAYTDATS